LFDLGCRSLEPKFIVTETIQQVERVLFASQPIQQQCIVVVPCDARQARGRAADIRAGDREYVDYVSALDRDQLAEQIDFAFTDGAPGRMSREEVLMHVITHGVGHRGQVSAVMLLNSVTPANDGFTTYLHKAEALTRRRTGIRRNGAQIMASTLLGWSVRISFSGPCGADSDD
jgi:hypothetical protein